MADKTKDDVLQEQLQAAQKEPGYSAAGLNSRADVENAMAGTSYHPSQNVTDAAAALQEWQQKRPGAYQSSYQERIDALLNQLLARENFNYSYTQDPLYRQYEQVYTQNARNASADAAAQAAALTGGYGSSYATSAAQQAYQQQIGALNNAIPNLYSLALDTYNSGGDDLVTRLDQLNSQEQSAQNQYNQQLSDYYTQLQQKGEEYNNAYAQDYGQYQDYLSQLGTLHDYYSAQEQAKAERAQHIFNGVLSVLGVVGDAVQLAISGTTGIGSMASGLLNTGYNILSGNRQYEADRADTQWNQQMQEKQYQDAQAQQKYDNAFAQQQYQDKLRQQQFTNDVTSEKLGIAKGEWALKQAKAAQQAQKASAAAAQSSTAAGASGASASGSGNLSVGKSGVLSSTTVPYTAARLRSQGKSDAAIRTELLKEGYSSKQVGEIMKQLNS